MLTLTEAVIEKGADYSVAVALARYQL
jgi:hypothetical protein